jgi:hypothetical protein
MELLSPVRRAFMKTVYKMPTSKPYLVPPQRPPIRLDRLAQMGAIELRMLHRDLFGFDISSGNSELARRRIAWRIQAEKEGGLPESARQHAMAIAEEASMRIHLRRGNSELAHATVTGLVSDYDSRLPMPGSVIIKEYQGRTILVRILDAGFEYDSRRFASLSAIAKEITGTKWNGFLFFGLTKDTRGR